MLASEGLFRTEDAANWIETISGISARSLDGFELDEPRLIIKSTVTTAPRFDVSIDQGEWTKGVTPPISPIGATVNSAFIKTLASPPWAARRYAIVYNPTNIVRVEGTVNLSLLFVTDDDGATWSSQTITGVDVPEVLQAVSDPGTQNIPQIMVGTYRIWTCTRQCLVTGTATVISNDGGLAWRKMGALPAGTVISLAIAPTGLLAQVPIIYAGLSTGIARSTDGGASFQTISTLPVGGALWVDPSRSGVLYSATLAISATVPPRFYRSADGGVSWTEITFDVPLSLATGVVADVAFSESRPNRTDVAVANGMLARSEDGGVTWQTLSLGLGEQPSFIQFGRHEPRTAYFGSRSHGVAVFTIARDTPVDVIEFYNTTLDHYFVTMSAEEALGIDRGAAGPGWVRKGVAFHAWLSAATAPAEGRPVCRFYGTPGRGPNSHFYTVSPAECASVKKDAGWTYEGTAFYVLAPQNDQCPGSSPVYRAYNNRFASNDSNHRYVTQLSLLQAMTAQGWSVEGVAFCSPN